MAPHFIILASEARFRVLERFARPGQTTASLREMASHDFVPIAAGARAGERSSGFGLLGTRGLHPGGGYSPPADADHRRAADWLADQVERFLMARPGLAWAFAVGPEILNPVLERLRPSMRGSLVESVQRNLIHTPPSEIPIHLKVRI